MKDRPRARGSTARSLAAPRSVPKVGILQRVPIRIQFAGSAVLLCLLAVLAYGNSIQNGWVWDDTQQIATNPDLRPGAPVGHLFAGDVWSFSHSGARGQINYYRPMQMLTYRVVAKFFDFDPHAFHVVNVGFHLLATVLTFALFWRLSREIATAFAGAAIFAVHPVHTEAVDWVSALPDIGCTVTLLFAFLFFILARERSDPSQQNARSRGVRLVLWCCSCLLFGMALLWKETAVIFPLLAMAYVVCLQEFGDPWHRFSGAVRVSLPYWLILCGYFLLRFRVLGFLATRQRDWILSPFAFALTAMHLVAQYWWKLALPTELNAYYVFSPVYGLGDPRAIIAILFLVAALAGIWVAARRAPLVAYSGLWLFITLIPVLNIFGVGRNVFTERYLYLPSVGFCLLVVLLARWIGGYIPRAMRWPAAALSLAAVLVLFTWRTVERNPEWEDNATLFAATLETSPDAAFVQNMVAALQKNDAPGVTAAEDHYRRAIASAEREVPPNYLELARAYEGLAPIYAAQGEFDRSIELLDKVRRIDPKDPEVDAAEGLILAQAGRWAEAEKDLRRAIAIAPGNVNVLNALGLLAWQHYKRLDDAANYFSKAISIHSEADDFGASLHSNLGGVYGEQGRTADAIQQLRIAVSIAPEDPEFHTNLGTGLAIAGRFDEARSEFLAALARAPAYEPARLALQQLPRH